MPAGVRPATMRAVQYSGYGGSGAGLKFVEVPVPSVKKNEVLIKVEAGSINQSDWMIQKGMLRPFHPKFPFIPVNNVSGEIIEVGSAVREFKTAGGLAEYVATSEKLTVARPVGVSAADAAGLPVAGLTALQALRAIGTKFDGSNNSRTNVLITAASSGVGTYAVQLAKLGNHCVTATCGARNLDLITSLGADEVIDYKTPEGATLTSPSGKNNKYDYIVNISNQNKWSTFKRRLSDRGRVVDVSPNFRNFVASVTTRFSRRKKLSLVILKMSKQDLGFLLELMRDGKLKTVVDSRYPLEKAADAWERSMSGHATGKVIVEM